MPLEVFNIIRILRALITPSVREPGDLRRNAVLYLASRAGILDSCFSIGVSPDLDDGRFSEVPYLAAVGFLVGAGVIQCPVPDNVREALNKLRTRSAHTRERTGYADDPISAAGLFLLAQASNNQELADRLTREVHTSTLAGVSVQTLVAIVFSCEDVQPLKGSPAEIAAAMLLLDRVRRTGNATAVSRDALEAQLFSAVAADSFEPTADFASMVVLAALECSFPNSTNQNRTTRRSRTMQPLRILHISDLHERAEFAGMPEWRRAQLEVDAEERGYVLGGKFLAFLKALPPIDLVLFTGDLADWGHPAEYAAASQRLELILNALSVPRSHFFAVPGNHDVQRNVHEEAWDGLRRWYGSTQDTSRLGRWFRGVGEPPPGVSAKWREQVLMRTSAFWDWLSEFGRPDLRPKVPKMLGYRYTLNPGEFEHVDSPVHIIGLDSAWLCGDNHDQGKILVTEQQVQAHARAGEHTLEGLRIALLHHPLDHLADHHHVRRLIADDVDLLLHGHQHDPLSLVVDEPGARLRILAAGCLMEGELGKDWPNGFNVLELDVRESEGTAQFWKWSKRMRSWTTGSDIYREAPDGILALQNKPRTPPAATTGGVRQGGDRAEVLAQIPDLHLRWGGKSVTGSQSESAELHITNVGDCRVEIESITLCWSVADGAQLESAARVADPILSPSQKIKASVTISYGSAVDACLAAGLPRPKNIQDAPIQGRVVVQANSRPYKIKNSFEIPYERIK